MKTNNIFTLIALVAAMVFTSCQKWQIEETATAPSNEKPIGYVPVDDKNILVVFDNDATKEYSHKFALECADTLTFTGNEAVETVGADEFVAKTKVTFQNNYDDNDVTVKGLTLKYKHLEKEYNLSILPEYQEMLKVIRTLEQVENNEGKMVAKDTYLLVFDEILLASNATVFVVAEEVADAIYPVYFKATNVVGKVDVTLSDSTVVRNVNHSFTLNTTKERKFEGNAACLCTGETTLKAAQTVTFKYTYCTNDVTVSGLSMEFGGSEIDGKAVAKRTIKCRSALNVVSKLDIVEEVKDKPYHSKSVANYSLQESNTSLATTQTTFIVDEAYTPPTVLEIKYENVHISFDSEATWVDASTIMVIGNHTLTLWQSMSDGTKKNEQTFPYKVKYYFTIIGYDEEITVEDLVKALTDYDFTGNIVKIGDKTITVSLEKEKTEFVGEINYLDEKYNHLRKACNVNPIKIDITSSSSGKLTFDNEKLSNDDKSIANLNLNIKEQIKLVRTEVAFAHDKFNTPVAGSNSFSIPCDNHGIFTKVYSDESKVESAPVLVTIDNNYSISDLTFIVKDETSIVGEKFDFTDGTASVIGKNIVITHIGRVFSEVMFEGKSYTDKAKAELDCMPIPTSIKFISTEQAEITLVEKEENIVVTVPANIIVAETITGNILLGGMTDAYMRQIGSHDRTDLHIMAENNGIYTVYSRQNSNEDWTLTNLTSDEANSIINSGRQIAWIWNSAKSVYQIGTVNVINRENEDDRYILEYYTLKNVVAYRLGKQNETIGEPWRNAIRGVLVENNGMYSLEYRNGHTGEELYFVGK